jgi:hypothetical protein
MIEILATIRGPTFHVGITLHDDKVVEAAPIISFMRGWSRDRVRDYCSERDWQISIVWEIGPCGQKN